MTGTLALVGDEGHAGFPFADLEARVWVHATFGEDRQHPAILQGRRAALVAVLSFAVAIDGNCSLPAGRMAGTPRRRNKTARS